jgi:hypothetical protein
MLSSQDSYTHIFNAPTIPKGGGGQFQHRLCPCSQFRAIMNSRKMGSPAPRGGSGAHCGQIHGSAKHKRALPPPPKGKALRRGGKGHDKGALWAPFPGDWGNAPRKGFMAHARANKILPGQTYGVKAYLDSDRGSSTLPVGTKEWGGGISYKEPAQWLHCGKAPIGGGTMSSIRIGRGQNGLGKTMIFPYHPLFFPNGVRRIAGASCTNHASLFEFMRYYYQVVAGRMRSAEPAIGRLDDHSSPPPPRVRGGARGKTQGA